MMRNTILRTDGSTTSRRSNVWRSIENVWFGGSTVVCPGVHIGDNVVIGAGSVVIRDIPDWCIAAGNPCRVIRKITEGDRRKLFYDEGIDGEAWQDILERVEF